MVPRPRHLLLVALTLLALLVFANVKDQVSLTLVEVAGGLFAYVLLVLASLCLFRAGASEERELWREQVEVLEELEWEWPPRKDAA